MTPKKQPVRRFDILMQPAGSISGTVLRGNASNVDATLATGCGVSGFKPQWWNNAASAATATIIAVSDNATVPGIDATLQQ